MNKELIKKRFIEINRVISFVLTFFILLEVCSLMFFSSRNATGFKNRLQDAYSFVDEPGNTIQIVGVGNSNIYSGFSPLDLWNEYGYTSTICASAKQSIQESKHLIKRVYEKQNPQIVLIETDMLYDHDPNDVNNLEKSMNLSDFFDSMKPEYFERDIENIFTVFKFHNKWKSKSTSKKKQYSTHGYRYNNKTVRLKYSNYMNKTGKQENISKLNKEQMDSLILYCQKRGASVILVSIPSVASWNYERHYAVEEYAKSKGLPFIDFNLLYGETNMSIKNCFRDKGNHLNYKGAQAVTKYLGNYISNNYSIESLSSNEAFNCWNDEYKQFLKSINKK